MGCLIDLKFCEVWQNSFLEQILNVSAFYLKKQKSFIPINKSSCQYQNKKAMFTNPILSEGFGIGKGTTAGLPLTLAMHIVSSKRFGFYIKKCLRLTI